MTPNELLLWLSARKQGSWPQFRGAVEKLDLANDADESEQDTKLPVHQRVRFNLERLGHVEFDAAECEDGWRVVPPTLAIFQHDSGFTGILCGARTSRLMQRIEQAGNGVSFERAPHTDCPDVIRVHAAQMERLTDFAQRESLGYQLDSPAALLSRLPSVEGMTGRRGAPMPASGKDWEVKQFIIKGKMMKWRTVTVQEANAPDAQGLYCFTRFQMPQYFVREGRETIALPGAVGKYRVLSHRHRRVLRYDRRARCLTLPAILRPPLLTERGLILCSGFPPALGFSYGRRMLTYRDIPDEVAGMTAEILRQDFV